MNTVYFQLQNGNMEIGFRKRSTITLVSEQRFMAKTVSSSPQTGEPRGHLVRPVVRWSRARGECLREPSTEIAPRRMAATIELRSSPD
jgi:translation elongation factor EF-Tu-like GTPase